MASSEMFIIVLLTTMKERLHKRFHMKSELPKHKRVKKQLAEGRGGGGWGALRFRKKPSQKKETSAENCENAVIRRESQKSQTSSFINTFQIFQELMNILVDTEIVTLTRRTYYCFFLIKTEHQTFHEKQTKE